MTREGYLKHKVLIDAWARGAEIQFKTSDGKWVTTIDPAWRPDTEYRIRQLPLEKWLVVDSNNIAIYTYSSPIAAEDYVKGRASVVRVVHMKEVGND